MECYINWQSMKDILKIKIVNYDGISNIIDKINNKNF